MLIKGLVKIYPLGIEALPWVGCSRQMSNVCLTFEDRFLRKFNSKLCSLPFFNQLRNVCLSTQLQTNDKQIACHNSDVKEIEEQAESRLLKVAIIGVPNVGKSTVINNLVGRKVCPISSKVHTTRCRARAIMMEGDVQLVFLDTPGLVTATESNRHHLETSFIQDSEKAMVETDVIGVVHDVSNKYTRDKLDPKVLRLLHLYSQKNSFLILNKIDLLKSKRTLLDLVQNLTNNCMEGQHQRERRKLSESQVKELIDGESGWSHFSQVFMVSALTNSGLSEVLDYLLGQSRLEPWLYSPSQFTDQIPETVVVETVRARLLEHLPQEIPYNLKVCMEYFHITREGIVKCVVLVECLTLRLERLVVGTGGRRIRTIAVEAEQELFSSFRQPVHLKLMVTTQKK